MMMMFIVALLLVYCYCRLLVLSVTLELQARQARRSLIIRDTLYAVHHPPLSISFVSTLLISTSYVCCTLVQICAKFSLVL